MNAKLADTVEEFMVAKVAIFQANDAPNDMRPSLTITKGIEPFIKLVSPANVRYVSYMIRLFKVGRCRQRDAYLRFFALPANGLSVARSDTRIGTPGISKLSRRLLVR